MRCDSGDLVLVAFPFTDQSTTKRRPAVVISTDAYSFNRPDLILMAVTSQIRGTAAFGDVPVLDWQLAGLLKPSAIKPVMATFEQALIMRRLGALSPRDQAALRSALAQIIG